MKILKSANFEACFALSYKLSLIEIEYIFVELWELKQLTGKDYQELSAYYLELKGYLE